MISLTSTAFFNAGRIPAVFTCDGKDEFPPLTITGIPVGTKSLALIVDDPDSRTKNFVHWLVWNIKPENQTIIAPELPAASVQGTNSFGRVGYGGPCPAEGTHRYFFKVLALDIPDLNLAPGATIEAFNKAAAEHVLDYGILIGLYSR